MLQLIQISKSYGAELILNEVSFVVNPGERIGLIGANGSGKTTLLRIIAGEEQPDGGQVSIGSGLTIGYLPQGFELEDGQTVGATVRAGIEGYAEARIELRQLELAMSQTDGADLDAVLAAYDQALIRFEALGGYDLENRVEPILAHLDLDHIDPEAPIAQLSGGQKTRVGLARLLIAQPDILLLDEPTNHLDITALEWLEDFLARYSGAVLVVSHDRVFLDQTISSAVYLDQHTHTATVYPGNYSDLVAARQLERQKQWAQWTDQQEEVRRIEAAIRRTEEQAKRFEGISKHDFQRRKAKVLQQKATARKTRLERMLDSDDQVEKPRNEWHLKIDFGPMPRGGDEVITLNGLGHRYPGRAWLFKGVDLTLYHGQRIALLGANGTGKSTLLRAIEAVAHGDRMPLAAGEIKLGANVRIGYMPQEQDSLDPNETPLGVVLRARPMNETDARSFLHYLLFSGDEVFTPISSLSYGQRSRLLMGRIMLSGANCLVLDEP
ncbi:MAG: ABC-F family ATP-binding cassette domain-containing protein, partial [Chloroflexi bacterium]|nr:ABC-F family ATP-binding cassette domain-containing protein [Chloroflexota bacterium]